MIISEKLLTDYGAKLITLDKNEHLFSVDDSSGCYFQVESGYLKITSDKSGKNQFIHDFSNAGDPVGETFLFSDNLYNVNAVALSHSSIYVLSKEEFYELLNTYPKTLIKLLEYISEKVNYNFMLINKMAYSDPRGRILLVINHFKKLKMQSKSIQYEVPYTRQQLASLTGLRVETVIRTVKIMENENLVEIIDGKIFIKNNANTL
ncbi:Crp/Fnr family transcriptional regulator [Chryseobacterium formosus]|uniref:Crp/Fnr family transcriptional regulator n=1 Tax=Chryseobacterium formosus TaxID=1537363 RepID=A0ABT3XXP4_9FLAO|nr:Crp/Fnr family transcriptional regulator [Chryseobacterium formosus]MCX8526442.1 Crp/Fnr family transcriptional regulator [Chryseobacterium formosus]